MSLAITGLGVVCAAGFGVAALRERVLAGGTALTQTSRVDTIDPGWTGTVPDSLEPLAEMPDGRPQTLCLAWALAAAREALDQAELLARVEARRIGVVLGSNLEDHPRSLVALVAELGDALQLEGPRLVTSLACASSHGAFSLARTLLERGDVDAVLVGGSDVLTPRVAGGFAQLGLICPEPSVPFSTRVGTSLGEGAAMFVLERESTRPAIAWLLGEGLAADAHHETAPEPRGRGTVRAIRAALDQVGLAPDAVDLVVAHGTGTLHNDAAEARAIAEVFGPGSQPAVTALKGLFGHAQGAAGALELAAALLAREQGKVASVPGWLHVGESRGELEGQLVIEPLDRTCARLLVDGAGFGGAHGAVLVGDPLPTRERAPARACRIAGWSTLEHGDPPPDWRRAVRGVDLRPVDPITRMLTVTSARALASAHASRRFDAGLIVGQRHSNRLAVARMREQIDRYGLARTAASSFVDSLTVMPAGACTRTLELWGPLGVTCADACAGLLALCWAAAQLEHERAPTWMVAACVEEGEHEREQAAMACVLGERGEIEIRGRALARRGHEALALALDEAELEAEALAQVWMFGAAIDHPRARPIEDRGAATGGLALAQACEHLRTGDRAEPLAIVCEDPNNLAVALVLTR